MKGRALSTLVVIVVLLAGCTGGTTTADAPTSTPTDAATTTVDAATTATTADSTTTQAATPATTQPTTHAGAYNPWGKDTLTVGVSDALDAPPDIRPLTEDAVDYWNDNMDATLYDIELVYRPDDPDPDIRVKLVQTVGSCWSDDDAGSLGCAPVTKPGTTPADTQFVEIAAGYGPNSTRETIKHELGHVLGLEHGDEPADVMAAESEALPYKQPSVRDRDHPWYWNTTNVYVDTGNVSARDARELRDAAQYAFDYYENGAEGYAPDGFGYVLVENRSKAHVVVSVVDEASCRDGGGSCQIRWGTSTDSREDVLNYWTYQRIELHDTDADTWSWRIAAHFGFVMGAESFEDLPPALATDDWDERRGDWWR